MYVCVYVLHVYYTNLVVILFWYIDVKCKLPTSPVAFI